MTIELISSGADRLGEVVRGLREWQRDAAPLQLHPGDVGWFWRFGAQATAAAVRTWRRDDQLLAVGLLDGSTVLRMTVAPSAWRDRDLAEQVVADVSDPGRGVLPAGPASVEAPNGTVLQDVLDAAGWRAGEPWTPLRRDLAGPVARTDVRISAVGPDQVSDFTAVLRSAFDSTRFTDDRWHAMTAGAPFADARGLLARDDDGTAVAAVTAWSAGPGRPGLVEPMGVHADHRGRGYGRAVCLAAAATLRSMGSSSVLVCTPSALAAAVATYSSAGFQRLPERLDRSRDA